MESAIPEAPKLDERALRARRIIILVMAALIVAPVILYLIVQGGFVPRP